MKHFFSLILLPFFLIGCVAHTRSAPPTENKGERRIQAEEIPVVSDMRKQLGREFLMAARDEFKFVRDSEVLSLVNTVGREIVSASGGDPDYYHFFVISKNEINAFAVPGGYIFLYDGLLKNLGSIDALAGVLAHEIAHVERDHHFKDSGKMALADLATLAGMILTGVAGDRPDASIAIGQGANIAYKLKLSREHEEDADLVALRYLRQSGYDPAGLLDFFKRLSRHDRLNSGDMIPTYLSTHPGVVERQVIVEALIRDIPRKGGTKRMEWERIMAILKGKEKEGLNLSPPGLGEETLHYLKGLHAFKSEDYRQAVLEYEAALRLDPDNPVYHADLAAMYLSLQHTERAEIEAKESIRLSGDYASSYLVLALIAQNGQRHEEAARHFKSAERLDPLNGFIHYHMAGTFYALGRQDLARYHLGVYLRLNLKAEEALMQFDEALKETEDETFARDLRQAIMTLKRDGI